MYDEWVNNKRSLLAELFLETQTIQSFLKEQNNNKKVIFTGIETQDCNSRNNILEQEISILSE